MKNLFTIGVYGSSEEEFFQKLMDAKIDTFCDIRMRRGVRGAKYAYANSNRLQNKLTQLGIKYVHYLPLAPSPELKNIQEKADKKLKILRSERKSLTPEFMDAFRKEILSLLDVDDLLNALGPDSRNVVFFCVEGDAMTCHRSLVTEYLKNVWKGVKVIHL